MGAEGKKEEGEHDEENDKTTMREAGDAGAGEDRTGLDRVEQNKKE